MNPTANDIIKSKYLPYVAFCTLVFITYGQSVTFGLVGNDFALLTPLSQYNFWHTTNYRRPIYTLWMSILYSLFGLNSFPMHFLSLTLHMINGCLAYFILIRIGTRPPVAFLTVCTWSLLGGNAYAIVWLSESNDLIAMLFLLSATIVWTSMCRMDQPMLVHAVLASAFWFISLLTKEVSLLWGPGMVLLGVLKFKESRPTKKLPIRRLLILLFPLFFLAGYVLTKFIIQGPHAGLNPNAYDFTESQLKGSTTFTIIIGRIIHYIEGVVYNFLPLDLFESAVGIVIGIFIGAIFFLTLSLRNRGGHGWKDQNTIFALSWIFLFSLHSTMTPHPRTLYIPSLGLSLLLCQLALSEKTKKYFTMTLFAFAIYIGMQVRLGQQVAHFYSPSSEMTSISYAKILQKEIFKDRPELQVYLKDALSNMEVHKLSEKEYRKPAPWRKFVKNLFKKTF